MHESKIELTKRLQAAGLWDEASQYRDAIRCQLRAEGVPRREAAERAWEAAAEKYPPPPPPMPAPPLPMATPPQPPLEPPEEVEDPEVAPVDCPPEDVGAGVDFAEDVAWCYRNYHLVVRDLGGRPRCDFSKATSRPPSSGAAGLMQWAAENRTAFFKDLVPKALRVTEEVDEQVHV